MTTYKPILMRPVEVVTGTNDTIKVKTSGAGSYESVVIDPGVYASIFGVIWEFASGIGSAGGSVDFTSWAIEDGSDTDGKYLYSKLTFVGNHVILIDQEETARMLGWGLNTSTASSAAAVHSFDYQPGYCWIPRFQVANQGRFYRRLSEEFAGKKTKTGTLAGNSTGPTLNYRGLEFQNEKAYNLVDEGATKNLYYDGSHPTKNLQYFVKEAMTSAPTVAGNPSTRGFWYAPNWNDILGTISASNQGPSTETSPIDYTTDIGIKFDLATSPDKWAFCQFEEAAIPQPDDTGVPTGRELYNQANIAIHTADYPTFAVTPGVG
jgi:hypothetical protein